jgi:chorismate mutase/prephenate dehydratase
MGVMSHETPRSLDLIRADIESVDAQVVRLLAERARLAQEVGAVKGLDGQPYFTPERERVIFERLRGLDAAPLKPEHLVAIYREVISAARALEKPLGVAYWGPEGTFSHQAAIETFGRSTTGVPCDTVRDVFLAVEHGQADYGIVPIENSVAGIVPETLDMFPVTNVRICAETFLAVHHHLASLAASLEEVRTVYAGPQPATQCRAWLRNHVPTARVEDVVPTARAAQAATRDATGAAIVNKLCAEIYSLPILAEHLEDSADNRTRFVVIGQNQPKPSGRDKTSVMFKLRNRPGELYRVLGALTEHSVNLLMIESRPAPRAAFEYMFYVDCAGHRSDKHLEAALSDLAELALELTVLGSYPSFDPNLSQ